MLDEGAMGFMLVVLVPSDVLEETVTVRADGAPADLRAFRDRSAPLTMMYLDATSCHCHPERDVNVAAYYPYNPYTDLVPRSP
jgi:hypothetical protein